MKVAPRGVCHLTSEDRQIVTGLRLGPRPLGIEIKSGTEIPKRIAIIHIPRNNGAKHRREGVMRYAQPVSPRSILSAFID